MQAYLFISSSKVDPTTLISMIGRRRRRGLARRRASSPAFRAGNVQIGMGIALLIAGSIILRPYADDVQHATGEHSSSPGRLLAIGIVGNFVLGALMTIGVGLYAPCMILVALLGMQGAAAFPIMMGSCAFLMPVASVPFIEKRSYSPRAALGLTLGGLPAVCYRRHGS